MCMQCMAGAMTAGAGATGARAYLAAHGARWLTPRRMKAVTVALVVGALGASSLIVTGPTPAVPSAKADASSSRGAVSQIAQGGLR